MILFKMRNISNVFIDFYQCLRKIYEMELGVR